MEIPALSRFVFRSALVRIVLSVVFVILLATATGMFLFYRTAYAQTLNDLESAAKTLAGLIEAMAPYDAQYTRHDPAGLRAATMGLLEKGMSHLQSAHAGAQLIIGRRVGDDIQILRHSVDKDVGQATVIRADGKLAQAVIHALQGESGHGEMLDEDGACVLAGYAPVPALQIAFVYKVKHAAMRASYAWTAIWAAILVLPVIGAGVIGLLWYARLLQQSAELCEKRLCALLLENGAHGQRLYAPRRNAPAGLPTAIPRTDKDGDGRRMLDTAIDIAERKFARRELLASEKRLRDILDSIFGFIGLFTLDGILVDANKAPLQIAGLRRDEVLGLPFWETYWWNYDPQIQSAVKNALAQAAHGEQVRYETEVRVGDKRKIIIDVTFGPLRDAQGRITHLIGFGVDITERKRAEKELDRHNRHLEELVRARTAQLQVSLEETEVLLKEVHHRVKNNLAMVSAFLQLQMKQTDHVSAVNALRACDSRVRAIALVHKKLYQSANLSNIDMQDLYQELCDALHAPAEYKNISIAIDAHKIQLDMNMAIPCAMVVNELLNNALKHAFVDGRAGRITVEMKKLEKNRYAIDFSDNGCGLPEPFDMNESGSLGLQLVTIFVQQLRGTLHCERRAGTVFHMIFPD